MSSLVLSGDTSGTVSLSVPAVAGSNTLTIQAATATNSINTLATAVPSTSGTSIDFTSIPSWVKRITVMFAGVSLSGTSSVLVQIGAGGVTTSGYSSGSFQQDADSTSTAGFIVRGASASDNLHGRMEISVLNSATYVWTENHGCFRSGGVSVAGGGSVTLAGVLDRVRITTVNGTDTFDAGSINILYEG